jgi:hypothetical protein
MQTAKMSPLPEPAVVPPLHRLELEHGLFVRRLDTLRDRPYLTDADRMEEVRLKKLKLHLKDEMERMRRTSIGMVPLI